MRLRAFPFGKDIAAFAAEHERIFVVEMNRDAQMRTLLIAEAGIPAEKLIPVLSYDGMPMTARQIAAELRDTIESDKSVAQALRLSAVAM